MLVLTLHKIYVLLEGWEGAGQAENLEGRMEF